MSARKNDSGGENDAEKQQRILNDPNSERQDLSVVLQKDAECRQMEILRLKFSKFTGVAIKIKFASAGSINNLCLAIDQDAVNYSKQIEDNHGVIEQKEEPKSMLGMPPIMPDPNSNSFSGIKHLNFYDTELDTMGVTRLRDFLIKKPLIETIGFHNMRLQNKTNDFKKLMEGVRMGAKIRKISLGGFNFDQDVYGKTLGGLLTDGKQIKELELVKCYFEHPKSFFDMCAPMLTEKCRLNIFRLKKCKITNIEAKVLQYVLMKSRQIHTMEFNQCYIDSENLKAFIHKFDGFCQLKFLTIEGIEPDFSTVLDLFAETLGVNSRLEVLQMREMKFNQNNFVDFWDKLEQNRGLKKISVAKTDLTDRVVESMCRFVSQPYIPLIELDLSGNLITDLGLTKLCSSLLSNQNLKYLNLAGNQIREKGIEDLVEVLNHPTCQIKELSLNSNKINSDGIAHLAKVLPINQSMQMLDIGKNEFNDHSFQVFALALRENQNLELFDISRNKDLSDEISLVTLIESLAGNRSINTIDMTGLLLRKYFLKMFFLPALKKNITLKFVIGNYGDDVINEELQTNITIEKEIMPRYQRKTKTHRGDFRIRSVDNENTSSVNIASMGFQYYEAALKFVMYQDIRICNFSGLALQDYHLGDLCDYLKTSPNLRSIIIDDNELSDDGLTRIAFAIRHNTKLAHLSFRQNKLITNDGVQILVDVIAKYNTALFQLNFDEQQFSTEILQQIKKECALNRAIQEKMKPKLVEYTINDASVATVSQRTIDALKLTSIHLPGKRISKEVLFIEGANVASNFESALKCWRIYAPSVIQVEGQNLDDDHIKRLLSFLKGKNMINFLNLRRNNITNNGAVLLADFLVNHDQEIFKIDVQRNNITERGAQAMLRAAEKTVRLLDMKLFYGNRFNQQIEFSIKAQITANMQIISNRDTTFEQIENGNNKKGLFNVVLQDFGPSYTLSAIKSVQLLNILHLALPDNSISLVQTRILAKMIEDNPALKSLNLSHNKIDHECAILLGEALTKNDRLLKLDLSGNELGDLGVLNLLRPLIKQRFELNYRIISKNEDMQFFEQDVVNGEVEGLTADHLKPKYTFYIHPEDLREEKQQKNMINHFKKQVKILDELMKWRAPKKYVTEHEHPCSLLNLNLYNNKITLESYKAIWQLLEANQEICVLFDSPEEIQQFLIRQLRKQIEPPQQFSQQNPHGTYVQEVDPDLTVEHVVIEEEINLEDTQAEKIEGAENDEDAEKVDRPQISDEGSGKEEDPEESAEDKTALVEAETQKKKERRESQFKTLQKVAKICCWKGYLPCVRDPEQMPSYHLVLLWPFYKSQMEAHKYVAFINPLDAVENSIHQDVVAVMIYAWYIFYYITLLLPIFITPQQNVVFLAIYYTVITIWELIVVKVYGKWSDISVCSVYILTKVAVGNLRRLILHSIVFKGFHAHQQENAFGTLMLLIGFGVTILSLFFQIRNIYMSYQYDPAYEPLRPKSKKNEILAKAADFAIIEVLYRKMSLQGTERARSQAKLIAIDLNPDLKHEDGSWLRSRINLAISKANSSVAVQHLIFVLVPMFIVLCVGMTHDLFVHKNIMISAIIAFILDCIATFLMVDNNEMYISQSVDTEIVNEIALSRNSSLSFNDDERWYDVKTGAIVDPDLQQALDHFRKATGLFNEFMDDEGSGAQIMSLEENQINLQNTHLDIEDQEDGALINHGRILVDIENQGVFPAAPTHAGNSPTFPPIGNKKGESKWLEDKVSITQLNLQSQLSGDSKKSDPQFGPRYQGDLPEVNSEGNVLTKSGNIVTRIIEVADMKTIDPELDA